MENRKDEQQNAVDSSETGANGIEETNPESSESTFDTGSTGEPEETLESPADGLDDAGYDEGPEPSPAEQFADSARTQAGAAASALRRGEFMHSAAIDVTADSDDRLIAMLCYVTQFLIPLVMPAIVLLSASSKKRPFQRFHAIQSLALSTTFILFGLLLGVSLTIVAVVPIIGWLVTGLVVACLMPLLVLMGFLALAYYGFQAYQGKRFSIPGLTSFLQDQNWI
ncbi:MAG: DUF4870 domain-containing protein [Caldilineaceae bacterium]|nr:DUF4870 domain-containing protein [Caldilineaceae bacterium]